MNERNIKRKRANRQMIEKKKMKKKWREWMDERMRERTKADGRKTQIKKGNECTYEREEGKLRKMS